MQTNASLPPEKVNTIQSQAASQTLFQKFMKIWDKAGILIILSVFIIVLSLLNDHFLTAQNLLNVGRQVAVLSIISMGMLIVIITGNMDLTVGAWLGLAGAIMAGSMKLWGIVPGILIGFAFAIVVGFNNGFLTTRGKNLSVIVTLAMMIIFQGITLLYTNSEPITGFPKEIGIIGSGYIGPFPIPLFIAGVVALLVHLFLNHTVPGRELFAIGGNREAARLSGIPVKKRIIMAYTISSSLAALAGLVLTSRVLSAQPTAGVGEEMNAIGAVLIGGASMSGGAGSVIGTLAGVLILGLISNGLNLLQINPFYQYVIKGLIILFAILMDQWERK